MGKYLGLPAQIGKYKTALFAFVKDRVMQEIAGWKERLSAYNLALLAKQGMGKQYETSGWCDALATTILWKGCAERFAAVLHSVILESDFQALIKMIDGTISHAQEVEVILKDILQQRFRCCEFALVRRTAAHAAHVVAGRSFWVWGLTFELTPHALGYLFPYQGEWVSRTRLSPSGKGWPYQDLGPVFDSHPCPRAQGAVASSGHQVHELTLGGIAFDSW
ncbi:hypothetical protein Acr_17g0010520 [Actinidia rufa]|uniref:Uncharacterized protein n=1 Tax=Actinidia rufa TaxID=165716 RepID=A0A7J0G3X5_9ERIC|nr:hypothetical protein Acr_17g0010520 [Actinidia rufa]